MRCAGFPGVVPVGRGAESAWRGLFLCWWAVVSLVPGWGRGVPCGMVELGCVVAFPVGGGGTVSRSGGAGCRPWLEVILGRMTCDKVLEWVGEEVLKEYRNLHQTRGLKAGDRDVNYVGEGSGGESAMDPAGTKAGEALDDEDGDNEPAETAPCAFVANNLNVGSNRGT